MFSRSCATRCVAHIYEKPARQTVLVNPAPNIPVVLIGRLIPKTCLVTGQGELPSNFITISPELNKREQVRADFSSGQEVAETGREKSCFSVLDTAFSPRDDYTSRATTVSGLARRLFFRKILPDVSAARGKHYDFNENEQSCSFAVGRERVERKKGERRKDLNDFARNERERKKKEKKGKKEERKKLRPTEWERGALVVLSRKFPLRRTSEIFTARRRAAG